MSTSSCVYTIVVECQVSLFFCVKWHILTKHFLRQTSMWFWKYYFIFYNWKLTNISKLRIFIRKEKKIFFCRVSVFFQETVSLAYSVAFLLVKCHISTRLQSSFSITKFPSCESNGRPQGQSLDDMKKVKKLGVGIHNVKWESAKSW